MISQNCGSAKLLGARKLRSWPNSSLNFRDIEVVSGFFFYGNKKYRLHFPLANWLIIIKCPVNFVGFGTLFWNGFLNACFSDICNLYCPQAELWVFATCCTCFRLIRCSSVFRASFLFSAPVAGLVAVSLVVLSDSATGWFSLSAVFAWNTRMLSVSRHWPE